MAPMAPMVSGAAMGPGHESDSGHDERRTQSRNSRKFRNITPSLGRYFRPEKSLKGILIKDSFSVNKFFKKIYMYSVIQDIMMWNNMRGRKLI